MINRTLICLNILYCFREWTGDLKKLPNIKLRQVSKKDKLKEDEKAKDGEEDDKNSQEGDDAADMSESD